MEYHQTSDAPETVSPVSPVGSGMSFADLHFAGDWHAGENLVQQVSFNRPPPQSPVNEVSQGPTDICLHAQIAEQLRRSVSPASFTKAVSTISRGERPALPVVVVVVNDANVREFERRGCSCGPSSPTAPAQPSGGKCLCRLGLLLRKVSNGAKKYLPKRLSRRASSPVAMIQSEPFESLENQALATSKASSLLMKSHDSLQSNGGIAEPPELPDTAVFELPCPPSELAAQPHTPRGHVVERQRHVVGNVSERENWEPNVSFTSNSPMRPGSRWFSGTPFTTPRTSSLVSNTSTSTGGRSSLISMLSVSTFSGQRDSPSTPGSSILDKDPVASPVEYSQNDSDRSTWNDAMSRRSQASLGDTWSQEVANPWLTLPTATKPVAAPIAHDRSFNLELTPSNRPGTSHALWQDVLSPPDHRYPSVSASSDLREDLWGTSMNPLGMVYPTQHSPFVHAAESQQARPFDFSVDGVPSFFHQPPIRAPAVYPNFPSPMRAFHTTKTSLTMEQGASARGAIARNATRRSLTRAPITAIHQLPSVRNLGDFRSCLGTNFKRKNRVHQGPTSCGPCNFFPGGTESAQRKKVRKHWSSNRHRLQMNQKLLAKVPCPGRSEDGTPCRGRFSVGRPDNFKQHFGRCHPGQYLDDISETFLTFLSDDDSSMALEHNVDVEMN